MNTPIFAALLDERPDTPLRLCLSCGEIVPAQRVYPLLMRPGSFAYFCATHYAQAMA